jgi:hypothetical protein
MMTFVIINLKSIEMKSSIKIKSLITIIFLMLLFAANDSFAQSNLRLIKATSKKISIKDGNNPRTYDWNWLAENNQQVIFELGKNKKKRKVIFYTDIDSISFDVESNKKYEFNVLLNSKDSCRIQLSTVIPSYQKKSKHYKIADTIPFFLGKDNFIHIKSRINNSTELDFMFDTGADVICLTEKGYKKSKIILDGNVKNIGFGGVTVEKTSSNNKLEINDLEWKNLSIVCLECNLSNDIKDKNGVDGILGYNIFEDKIVEIDYGKSLLIIHNELPKHINSFTKIETKENLFIKLNLSNTKENRDGWFFFDTGSNSNLIVETGFVTNSDLFRSINSSKGMSKGTGGEIETNVVIFPELTIGASKLKNFPAVLLLEKGEDEFYKDGIIGNQILKRFNTIIDYPNLNVYLKPNRFINDSFKKKSKVNLNVMISISSVIVIFTFAFYFYIKAKLIKSKPNENIY